MEKKAIQLGNLTVSRLMAGGNPLSGFSHQSKDRDEEMLNYYTCEKIKEFFFECERNGIDAICARSDAFIMRVFREYWGEGGKARWIAQTATEYRDSYFAISAAVSAGAAAVYIHGGETDKICKSGQAESLHDIIAYGKKLGVPMGIAAHDPRTHLMIREMGVDNDFHVICMYNLGGYKSNTRPDTDAEFNDRDRALALDAARRIPLPCVLYKILGAGRKTMAEALVDVQPALKPTDGVLVGMFIKDDPNMVRSNAEAIFGLPQ